MTTDTPARDELAGYPCPRWGVPQAMEGCQPDQEWCGMDGKCRYGDVYRAHIKLRDDMRKLRAAVLGDMTAAVATKLYLRAALMIGTVERVDAMVHFNALANVVKGLVRLTQDERAVLNAAATGERVCMAILGPGSARRVAKAMGTLQQRGFIWEQQVALDVYCWRATDAGVEAWHHDA